MRELGTLHAFCFSISLHTMTNTGLILVIVVAVVTAAAVVVVVVRVVRAEVVAVVVCAVVDEDEEVDVIAAAAPITLTLSDAYVTGNAPTCAPAAAVYTFKAYSVPCSSGVSIATVRCTAVFSPRLSATVPRPYTRSSDARIANRTTPSR